MIATQSTHICVCVFKSNFWIGCSKIWQIAATHGPMVLYDKFYWPLTSPSCFQLNSLGWHHFAISYCFSHQLCSASWGHAWKVIGRPPSHWLAAEPPPAPSLAKAYIKGMNNNATHEQDEARPNNPSTHGTTWNPPCYCLVSSAATPLQC